jgi:hypothetical protein
VNPGDTAYLNAVLVRTNKTPKRMYLAPLLDSFGRDSLEPGRYELEVQATAGTHMPVPAVYDLTLAESGKVALTLRQA